MNAFSPDQILELEALMERVFKRVNREVRQENTTWVSKEIAMKELNLKSYNTLKKYVAAGIIDANNAGRGSKIEYRRSDILKFKTNRAAYAHLLKQR